MSRYTIEIDGIEYSVKILEDAGSEARVVVNGRELRVSVTAEAGPVTAQAPLPSPSPPQQPSPAAAWGPVAPGGAPGEVRAPMPARVTEVLARTGNRVKEGQLLLKIQAMKMENPIRSPIAGTVEMVYVSNGQEVAGGELLVKIDPR
jgi:biotin carboxyl carrier protein